MSKRNTSGLAGSIIGRWFVLELTKATEHLSTHGRRWICRCSCGTVKEVSERKLRNKETQSCGCLISDFNRLTKTKHGHAKKGKVTAEWRAWRGMMCRCYDSRHHQYKNYGARGISVYQPWHESSVFISDTVNSIGNHPGEGYTLGRLNNDEGYAPGNVAWQTPREQANNRRNSVIITYGDVSMTQAQWARELNISPLTIAWRRKQGWSTGRVLGLE